jgi:tetratricopeptide (TPR) repeat protein
MTERRQDSNPHDDLGRMNTDFDDRKFFDALETSVRNASVQMHASQYPDLHTRADSRLFRIQMILLAGAVSIALALVWRFTNIRGKIHRPLSQHGTAQYYSKAVAKAVAQSPNEPNQQQQPPVPAEKPLSLRLANDLFMQGNYQGAFDAYERLDQALPQETPQQLMHDFLKARMAVCLRLTNYADQAEKLLRIVCSGDSCALAAIANYQRALIEFERKQYLEARTYAYRAMALCEGVTADLDWALTFKKDCHFLVALALTRRIVTLTQSDTDIPARLWRTSQQTNFGCDMTQGQLDAFLSSGSKKLSQALLGPTVRKLASKDRIEHFQISSNMAPAEELFARFAASADMRLSWLVPDGSAEFRSRPVILLLPDVTKEEFTSIAAGCVGLQATISIEARHPTIELTNPAAYTELSAHIDVLSREALDLWEQFIIRYFEDKRLAEAHFASGLIHEARGETLDAVAQFKIVANRHGNSFLAPNALLFSSTIRTELHDYAGAEEDLRQLVEQYSRTAVAQKASLRLADAALKAGLYDQAANTYCKVYNIDDTTESRTTAAFGAARAYFIAGNYPLAETWIAKYFNLATGQANSHLHDAYLLLGKTLLAEGKRTEAFDAFKLALSEELTQKDRTDIIEVLLQCDLDQLDSIQALDILETLQSQGLTAIESTEALLMKCRILRKMSLPDKALAALNDSVDYILQPQLRAKAYFESARCLLDTGQAQAAHQYLVKCVALAQPGPLADEAALALAEVSLFLDKDAEAVELCSQLLARQIPDKVRRDAVSTLAKAYKRQGNYEKAATVLIEATQNAQNKSEDKTAAGNRQLQPRETLARQDS